MEYTMLRNSDLKVSRLCMGGCPMGGYGWGDTQENELIEAVHTAVDQGVNFFDTAWSVRKNFRKSVGKSSERCSDCV